MTAPLHQVLKFLSFVLRHWMEKTALGAALCDDVVVLSAFTCDDASKG
jgi:hypothetical protein